MKKISYLFIVITLMLVIGCQNEQEKTEEKIPVVDEFIGGSWVNDTTPDISFTLGRYVVGYEDERSASADVQLHAGDTTFEGTFSKK